MPILDERHDFMHPVEGDTAWSESYYFNCYDPVTDSGFFTRCGIRPNEGTLDIGMSVWLPGGALAQGGGVREQRTMIDSGLAVDGIEYTRIEPMRRWRITADCETLVRNLHDAAEPVRPARLRMEVGYEALMPAIGADGQGAHGIGASVETRKSVGKGHLEQAGRWRGWIEVDGARHELGEARGNRDKSWGPRTWSGTGSRMWRWFTINLGDDVHLGGIRIGTDAGDLHRGWIWKDGEHASVREWHVESTIADDGVTHTATRLRVTDKQDRTHEIDGVMLRNAPHRMEQGDRVAVLNEGLARWSYGDRIGYGISEYLHQLDEDGRPRIAIA